jgi:pimeloyl-ACP methyl ester carboxylesterase
MNTAVSRDGTRIAYDAQGSGPAVILVAGALCSRLSWSGRGLVKELSRSFTVCNYDRRGRGDSGDTPPYAVEREIEDIEALMDAAGGSAILYGHSSGASLALEAAARLGDTAVKLALYEAPYNDDPVAKAAWGAYTRELGQLLAAGRRGDAVALFMRYLGTPAPAIEGMRTAPLWPGLEALAPTLAYDHTAIMGSEAAVPRERAAGIRVPALVMNGSSSPPFMHETARALSQAIPRAQLRVLQGQGHDVAAAVLAPVLAEFFSA